MLKPIPSLLAFTFGVLSLVAGLSAQDPQALVQDAMTKQQAGDLAGAVSDSGKGC